MDRRRDAGKREKQLPNLRALASTPPRTKTGKVLWAWPEIQACMSRGRSLREIWEALQLDGIQMSYAEFRVYVSRARKRLVGQPEVVLLRPEPVPNIQDSTTATPPNQDPLANIRREQERKRTSGFVYSPFPDDGD
jgi:hypothetical protein